MVAGPVPATNSVPFHRGAPGNSTSSPRLRSSSKPAVRGPLPGIATRFAAATRIHIESPRSSLQWNAVTRRSASDYKGGTTVTPQQVKLVQDSLAKVAPISDKAAALFYGRVFEIAPNVFHGDMTAQGRHRTGHADRPHPALGQNIHAFTHGTSCPSRHRRTSPKCP